MLIKSSPRATGSVLSICFMLPFAAQTGLVAALLEFADISSPLSASLPGEIMSLDRFLALGVFLGGHLFPGTAFFNWTFSVYERRGWGLPPGLCLPVETVVWISE